MVVRWSMVDVRWSMVDGEIAKETGKSLQSEKPGLGSGYSD
jgi:hypothetical protein